MRTVVAVVDGPSIFRTAIAGVLREAGLHATEFDATAAVAAAQGVDVVVLPLRSAGLWHALSDISTAAPVVAVLPEATDATRVTAIRKGATSSVAEDCDPRRLVTAVYAAVTGMGSVRSDILRELASRSFGDAEIPRITEPELTWLRECAAGSTIGTVAKRNRVCERTVYRRLGKLRDDFGTNSIHELIAMAERERLLD